MDPRLARLIKDLLGDEPTSAALVSVLEQDRFLVSAQTGFTDRQVRLFIISELARIGDASAIDILTRYHEVYGKFGDDQVAQAAANAIHSIEARAHGRQVATHERPTTLGLEPSTPTSPDVPLVDLLSSLLRLDRVAVEVARNESRAAPPLTHDVGVSRLLTVLEQLDCDSEILANARRLLPRGSENIDLWIGLATALRQTGHLQGALATYDMAIRAFPERMSHVLFSNRGLLLMSWERYHEAIDSFETALALKPAYLRARFLLAQTFECMHQFDRAIVDYTRVIDADPSNHFAWNNLGICHKQSSNLEQAYSCYRKSLEIDPAHADALYNAAALCCEQGRFDRAKDHVDRLSKVAPGDRAATELADKIAQRLRTPSRAATTYAPRSLVRREREAEGSLLREDRLPFATYSVFGPANLAVRTGSGANVRMDPVPASSSGVEPRGDGDVATGDVLFLSYKWESAEHCLWVARLAIDLTKRGYRVIFDRFHWLDGRDVASRELGEEQFIWLQLDRTGPEVPRLVGEISKATLFVPILTEAYRRCVEPGRFGFGSVPNDRERVASIPRSNFNDGWVFEEWQLALRLLLGGRIRWRAIWRSGPAVPPPFSIHAVCSLKDGESYQAQLDRFFPGKGRGGSSLDLGLSPASQPSG